MKHFRIVVLTILILIAGSASAQSYNFRHYNSENGLDHEYIYGLGQDADGALLIATGEGVTGFDGHRFYSVYNGERNDQFVTSILYDSGNTLWLGLQQNGIIRIKKGLTEQLRDSLLINTKITALTEGNDGEVWIGTSNAGLWKTKGHSGLIQVFAEPGDISTIAFCANGNLLAGSTQGLFVVKTSGENFAVNKVKQFSSDLITQITNEENGQCWILSSRGLSQIKFTESGVRILKGPATFSALGIQDAQCFGIDQQGSLWVGTAESGVLKLEFDDTNNFIYSTFLGKNNGFAAEHIRHIFRDREDNLWFGSFGQGLIQKPQLRFVFYQAPEPVGNTAITAVYPVNDTSIWLASRSGISHFNKTQNIFRTFPQLSHLHVSSISLYEETLWIGTFDQGLFTFSPATGDLSGFSSKEMPTLENVNYVCHSENKMYVCSNSGLYIFNHKTGQHEHLRTDEGLLHNNVKYVFPDSKGRLWVASHGAPPYYIYQRKAHSFRQIPGLRTFNINSYTQDEKGNIWIGTEGDGAFFFDDSTFTQYNIQEGLLTDYCSGIVVNRNGSVWITHRGGLSEKKADRVSFRNFTRKKGLLYTDNTRNSAARDKEGNLWFGTTEGLILYDASHLQGAGKVPETRITRLFIDQEEFTPGTTIRKDFGHYPVRVEFISIALADPAATTYRFRLLSGDTSWRSTDEEYVEFPQLSDGHYTFEVAALNDHSGQYDPTPASITFIIKEPVWRTAWFYLTLLLLVIIITYLIVRIRTRSFRQRQVLLELKVKQKTFLLQREKDAVVAIKQVVEQKNKDITDSINYAKKIQDSILPPDEKLRQLFGEEHFVFFRPKDIVSGDIYWAASLKVNDNNKTPLALAAVVDCTGHGVPGAFLSIMANDFLRQSIIDPQVNRPDHILNFLNEKISSHLNQSESSQLRDGMDIALVGIDHEKRILYFSGANNPIYIYRKTGDTWDQIILTATKQPIGMVSEETVKFACREFRLLPGDIIYLFSDGYADQFGGENNKKFTYKRFREALTEACEMPFFQQKNFMAARFDEWKLQEPQTDDVCVMGIRIS